MKATLALALALSVSVAGGARADCGQVERNVAEQASDLPEVADDIGALRGLGEAAIAALSTCPNSARLWYFAARAAEVLDEHYGRATFAPETAASLASAAAAHAPQSAEVATIVARETGKLADARRAYDLNPDYAPARRAYAEALAQAGKPDEALKRLAGSDRLDQLARARVLLRAQRLREAESAARRALSAPAMDGEPGPEAAFAREANEALGLALVGEGRKREAREPLETAAGLGSRAAQAALAGR
jgi:tetratricopeptide (TPR) repeat protein